MYQIWAFFIKRPHGRCNEKRALRKPSFSALPFLQLIFFWNKPRFADFAHATRLGETWRVSEVNNMMADDNYCIRADYLPRESAETIELSPGEYWTADRKRLAAEYQYDVYEYVARLLGEGRDCLILDVGCGYPIKAATLLRSRCQRLVLADQPTLQETIAKDFPDLEFIPINLANPSGLGQKFDVIVCADVIEHLLDPDPAMSFFRHHLSPKGRLVLSTPERIISRGPDCVTSDKPEHVREWAYDEFANYVESRGFVVREHKLLPVQKLPKTETLARRLLVSVRKTRRWAGTQMVICELPKD